MTERAITFPKTDIRHWVNAETGVTIEQGSYLDARRYKVHVPSQSESGWNMVAEKATLAEARGAARDLAISMRAQIARARKEALTEYAFYLAERAAKAIEGVEQAEAAPRSEIEQLWSYYTNALLFRSTDPARSISWSQEVLEQTDAAADRETGAAQSEITGTVTVTSSGWRKIQKTAARNRAAQALDVSTPLARSIVEADHAEALVTEAARGEALAAWGRVWAGHIPSKMIEAFETGDFATARRLADEQVARQEQETADHEARDAAEAGAWRDHLAREWYAHGGFASALTGPELSAGYADWDEWVSQPVYPTELADRTASYAAADRALSRPDSLSYLAGGLTNLALLATKDAALLPPSHSQAPQLDGGRPEGWGAAWLQEKHPAHLDLLNSTASVDPAEYLRLATEPQAGRFFPGPM